MSDGMNQETILNRYDERKDGNSNLSHVLERDRLTSIDLHALSP